MIRAFIFDIGNVLLRFDFSGALQRLGSKCDPGAKIVREEWDSMLADYETGKIARAEFSRQIKQVLRYTGTDPEFISAWQEIFEENHAMTDLVRKLNGRYPLYLLSNTSDLHMDYIQRTYPVFELFTDAVYSYRAKCAKPGREIFEIAIRQFHIAPEETIYIDDLVPNVEAALQLGFRAIHYNPANHDELLAALSREGVTIQ